MSSPPVLLGNRYELLQPLGSGAMGQVYQAHDSLTERRVALKRVTIHQKMLPGAGNGSTNPNGSLRLALAQEFRTLSTLRHPNIISVLDYGFDQQRQPYFTMNLLPDAQTLLAAGQGQPLETQIDLLIQLLQALVYLHRRGILHRDLKPENVLIVNGSVYVLDFGLAAPPAQRDAGINGTLAYMAPELLRHEPASPASDLYAVGVMAYQLLTGVHPFHLVNPSRLLASIIYAEPDTTAIEHPQLAVIVARLLQKSPAARYATAGELIADLCTAVNRPLPPESAAIRDSFLQAAQFVGRRAELQQLTDALEAAAAGRGSAWLVGGESGVGKSRLLDELRIRALISGATVLRGQDMADNSQPYQLWRDLLRHLALTVSLSDLQASVIKPLVPDIETLLRRPVADAPALTGPAHRQRLHLTIADICQAAAKNGPPLALLLEDLHWSRESLEPLRVLSRLVANLPLLIIGSYRSEERPSLPNECPTITTLPLTRLAAAEVEALSVSMLGEVGKRPSILHLLHKETEGNTFFLVETMRALAEEAGRLDAIGRMALPETVFAGGVQRLLRRRLGRIAPAQRPLLNLAAIAGRALDLPMLRAASPTTGLESWLAASADVAVLEVQEGTWRFAHDKLREALLADLTANQRQALHRQAAEAYERAYPDNPAYAAILSGHWLAANVPHKVVCYARAAGEHLAAQYVNEEAVQYFNRALAWTAAEETAVRFQLLLQREEIHNRLGQRSAQAADLAALAPLAEAPAQKAELALRLGAYHNNLSDYQAALEAAQKAYRRAAECADGDKQTQALILAAQARQRLSDYALAAQTYAQALALAQAANNQPYVAQIQSGMGEIATAQGDYAGAAQSHRQVLATYRALGNLPGQMKALQDLGETAVAQGDYQTARDYFLAALQSARQMGDRPGEARLLLNLGECDWRQSAFTEAESTLQQSLNLTQTVGDKRLEGRVLRHLGIVADFLGQYNTAISYHEQSLAMAQAVGDRLGEAAVLRNLGVVTKLQGRHEHSQAYYNQSLAISREIGDRSGESLALIGLAGAAKSQGQHEQAVAYSQQSLTISREIGDRYGESAALSNLAYLLTGQRQYAIAISYHEEILAISRESGYKYGESNTLNSLGYLALIQGQHEVAREYLQQSLRITWESGDKYVECATFNNLGMVAYSQLQYPEAEDYFQLGLEVAHAIGAQNMVAYTLNNIGALALARSDFDMAGVCYRQAMEIHRELKMAALLLEDYAGFALAALWQGEHKSTAAYIGRFLEKWVDNRTLFGANQPLRTLHFAWQVCQGLQMAEGADVLTTAVQMIQNDLEQQPDPDLREVYLQQVHVRPLWAAWQTQNKQRENHD